MKYDAAWFDLSSPESASVQYSTSFFGLSAATEVLSATCGTGCCLPVNNTANMNRMLKATIDPVLLVMLRFFFISFYSNQKRK
ncbi:MAG: hypothetical protein JG782_384 [Anaerophaga sp.]|nr:hypothetical protein [Anaerophaga sp.]